MKAWWKKLSVRIDALSLRERVFLFVSVLASSMALADLLWIAPAQTGYRQVTQRIAVQQAELLKLREELKSSAGQTGGAKAMQEELAQVKASIDAVNGDIGKIPSSALDATPLSQVLAHFLRRHEGLTLVRTSTLAPDADAAKATQGAGGSGLRLTRQGLELTVSGPYPELIRYVQTLERAMPALRWGTMKMVSEKQPPQLTLQVSLVEVSK